MRQQNRRIILAISVMLMLGLLSGLTVMARRPEKNGGKPRLSALESLLERFGFEDEAEHEPEEQERERVFALRSRAVDTEGPISAEAQAFGITSPIRDTQEFQQGPPPPDRLYIQEEENNEVEVDRVTPLSRQDQTPFTDKLAEKSRATTKANAPLAMPGPSLSFDGILSNTLLNTFGTTSMPPDTNGDVGPSHYVQTTNMGVFRVFDKNGTALGAPMRISSLFSGLPANNKCRLRDNGDPVVVYDQLADRWLITQFAIGDEGGEGSSPYYQCMAVSQTGDPTGAYYAYAFQAPNSNFPDYPHWGVWTDGYYLATHEFNDAGTAYAQAGFFAYNRDKIIQGDSTANYVYFSRAVSFGQLPADIEGFVPPAAGTPEMFFEYTADEYGVSDGVLPYEFVPNYVTPASSTFTAKSLVAVGAFDPRDPSGRVDIEQPSPAIATNNLDSVGNRLMHRLVYRNLGTSASPVHSYVMNWTVNVSGVNPTTSATYQAGVRWEELRRSAAGVISVFDEGTHAPDPVSGTGRNRWMASIAQDHAGNVALGFTRTGPNSGENPDIVWAGRSGGIVAAGTMNEGEAVMFASTGVQQSGNSRWGDYSSMNVDPADDCTFWFTQEYRDSTYNGTLSNNPFKWSTRVGAFKFAGCTTAPKGQIAVNVTSCSTNAGISGALIKVSPGGFIRQTVASGAGASNISLAPGTYSITVTKGGLTTTQNNVVVTNGATTPANICLTGSALAVATAPFSFESCQTNSLAEPGELVTVNLGLQNVAGANTSNLTATLQASGGVTNPSAAQNYGVVTAGGSAVSRSFAFVVDSTQACGKPLTLTLALADGATNLGNITYSMPTCTTAGSAQNFDYAGGAVAIPDNSATGVNSTVTVSNVAGVIQDLNFQITGSAITDGSAGVDHSWAGDLTFRLTSPSGTTVTLIRQVDSAGGSDGACSNPNFFNTILDDEASTQIDSGGCGAGSGMSGSFKPANALSLFDGENPNGTWTLNVSDLATGDTGIVRNFRLVITPYTFVSSCTTAITTPPSNVSVAAGAAATFNVVATGRNLHFQWRKGTTNIPSAPDRPTYTIASVTGADVGSYDVVVSGSNGGPVTSNAASLTVTGGNTAPGITAGSALTRQQGTAGSVATIATVTDTETAAGSLTVTATTVPTGLTVTSITNTSGTITANVAAGCNATFGANTVVLTVSDGTTTATANLTVTVTANAAPVLGNYSNTAVNAGAGTTVTPSAAPTDNGSVASVTAAASAGFTGTLSGNATTGVITISNAGPGGSYTITVTATDNCGTTATKTFTLTVNSAPTITAGSALTRQQGTTGSVSTIATVNDGQTAAGSLTVTTTTVPAGLTVTSITNTSGTITANVAAACNATVGANTVVLTVSDGSLTATANLTVNVTANSAPVVGTYTTTTVTTGAGTTVTPSAAPSDNGSISTLTAVASAGFTGTLSANPATGVVTISNAGPANSYTITVTATDNCGTTAAQTFTLTVNAANTAPTITAGSALTRQQGTTGSVSTLATVNDGQTAAGSLTVTATTVPAGLTVTSITNTSGTITANVAAACNATLGANTVVLTVSDGALTATANLTVNVTANAAPTLGTYANTTINSGAGTTVTPTAAPADNGSVASVTAAASAGFTGTLSGNATTGVVTVTNAGPVGSYTITVTATDNCGTTATRTFTLTVNAVNTPPTITAGSALTRQQGTAGSVSTIATVADAQSAAGSLTVTATTVPTGLTVTNITNTNGTVTANVAAACNATVGANTVVLTVNDGAATTTANLTVNVTANAAPVQGTYANTSVNAGAGTAVVPNAAPTDNGSISGLAVAASAGFTGTLSVNNNTGEVTISNAGPAGSYTITITATDNCGATSTRTFTLTVNTPPVPLCAPAPSGLVAWYRGENNANDTAGTNHGTLQGALGFIAGQVGRAFNFDGTDDSVKVTATSALNVGTGSGLTLAVWVKPGDLTTRRPLFEWNNNTISGAHLWANVNCTANCTDTAGALYANLLDTNGNNHILQTGANVLTAGTFQYIVLTYDKTTGVAQLYRNGVSVASQNLGSFTPRTDYDLYLGFRPAGNGVTRYVGQLDEADVYSRALALSEVQALFNSGSTGKCLTPNCGTLAYSTGFDSTIGSEWSQAKTDLTPTGSRRFLGQFGNETASLSLNSLAAHTSVTVSFDLYVIRSWDGHTTSVGPDVFKLAVNGGATLLNSSFSNLPSGFSGNIQSYPDPYPGGNYPSYTGATETTTLGYTATLDAMTYQMDSVYRITKTFNHTGANLQLNFSALGLEALANESWGLDNVAILLDCQPGGNTPPTITAGSAVARQQGSVGSTATIATVSDAQTAAGSLLVTATTVPTGLTVSSITNSNGTITATVAAGCTATVGANTVVLTVTDGSGAIATANLTVNVAANTAPVLGDYSATTAPTGGGTTVTPSVPPSDNGSLNALTASAPGFTGTFTVNLATGVVTITNAGPAAVYTVTVTATDNCGATATKTFTLTVSAVVGGNCATTPANLAAWYRAENNGNDTQGGTAATLTNVTFGAGKVGQAFSLNGTTAFVGVPSRNLASAYSVEFWLNPARSSGYQHLVSNDFRSANFGALYQFGSKLSYWANNKLVFDSTATLALNQWSHIVLTYDGAQAKLYVNGVLDKTTAVTGLTLNTALRLGDGLFRDSSSTLQGLLDETSFYGRALTAAEAQALFNAGSNGKCGSNTPPTITAAAALPRQQGSPAGAPLSLATVSDGQTAAGTLTVTATTIPTGLTVTGLTNTNGLITGQIAAACNATVGANTIVLTVSDGALTSTANLTVNVTANTPPVLGTYANAAVTVGSGTTVTPTAAPSDNGSIASVTVSGATGLTVNAATGVVTVPNNLAANTYTVTVTATDNCSATATKTFTLTVSAVITCLNAPPNLAAWYRAENNGNDQRGGTAATLTNVTFGAGKVGQAFSLNGTTAFVGVPARNLASAYSVEFWLNPARSSGYQHLVSNDYRSANFGALYQFGNKLSYWANGKLVFDSTATLALNQWSHIVLTYDGAQAKLYVNGVLDKTTAVTGLTLNTALRLGDGLFRDSSSTLQGLLDEASFYGRALTAAEAQALFNAGSSGKCLQ